MKKDPRMFLRHILDSIELIEEFTRNKDVEEFLDDKQLQDSVIRRIEKSEKSYMCSIFKQPREPIKNTVGYNDHTYLS